MKLTTNTNHVDCILNIRSDFFNELNSLRSIKEFRYGSSGNSCRKSAHVRSVLIDSTCITSLSSLVSCQAKHCVIKELFHSKYIFKP